MNWNLNFFFLTICTVLSLGFPVLLDFEGPMVPQYSAALLNDYYDGGFTDPSFTLTPGPDFNIVSLGGFVVGANLTDNQPSPESAAAFVANNSLNVLDGFNKFSFYYSTPFNGTITIYSGFNATGDILQSIFVPNNTHDSACLNTLSQSYCNFTLVIADFNGTGRSVQFEDPFSAMFDGSAFAAYDDLFFNLLQGIEALSNVSIVAIDGGYPNILYILSPTNVTFPLSSKRISGLSNGEQILAIAQQRTTGLVWGVSNKNRLYQINPFTAVAFYQSTLSCNVINDNPTLHASFNPSNGDLHITTLVTRGSRDHFTVNAMNGQCLTIDSFTSEDGTTPIYPAGTAFDVDSSDFYLVNSLPDNRLGTVDLTTGEFTPIGPLGLTISGVGGFDIIPSEPNYGFAALYTLNSLESDIYRIDLMTGEALLIGKLNFTTNLLSFAAIVPTSTTPMRRYYANALPPVPIPTFESESKAESEQVESKAKSESSSTSVELGGTSNRQTEKKESEQIAQTVSQGNNGNKFTSSSSTVLYSSAVLLILLIVS